MTKSLEGSDKILLINGALEELAPRIHFKRKG